LTNLQGGIDTLKEFITLGNQKESSSENTSQFLSVFVQASDLL